MSKPLTTLKRSLLSVHFTEKEASVYLALLGLGQGTVSQIAYQANINRTTCYVILSILLKMRLARVVIHEPKQLYAPTHPKKIKTLVLKELKKNQARLELVDNMILELERIQQESPWSKRVTVL